MFPCLAYRQLHQQTNMAATSLVALAEFGLAELETEKRGQELILHGLLQHGAFDGSRGTALYGALRHLSAAGLECAIYHDPARTTALQQHLRTWVPDFELRLLEDLKSPGVAWESLDEVFANDARLLLVEALHSIRELRLHTLLVRRMGHLHVMDSATGRDYIYDRGQFAAHLASPVAAGAVAFAGAQYLFTGVAVRICKQSVFPVEKKI